MRARVLAGVFGSFARRYDVNPLVARLLGIAGTLVLAPLAYVAMWILMPKDTAVAPAAAIWRRGLVARGGPGPGWRAVPRLRFCAR